VGDEPTFGLGLDSVGEVRDQLLNFHDCDGL
jgi:hypothetical protein